MKASAWVWIGVLLVLLLWDVLVATHVIPHEPTLSMVARDWFSKSPAAVFAFGFLAGHLVWPQPAAKK